MRSCTLKPDKWMQKPFNKVNKNENYAFFVITPWFGSMSVHSFQDPHKFTTDVQLWWFIIYTNPCIHANHMSFLSIQKIKFGSKRHLSIPHTNNGPVSHSNEPFMFGNLLNMIHDLCCDYLTHANRPFPYSWMNFGSKVPETGDYVCFPHFWNPSYLYTNFWCWSF